MENLRSKSFFNFPLDVLEGKALLTRAEDAFHGLDKMLEIGGVLGIFNNLDLGKRDCFRIAERDLGIGSIEDAEILESNLDGKSEAANFTLIHLGRSIKDNEEGEEKSDEVGVGDEPAFVANVIVVMVAAPHSASFRLAF